MSLEAVIDFSIKLIPLINSDFENSVIFSPASIFNGLAMVLPGAKGETAQQLSNLLGKDKFIEDVVRYYSDQSKSHKNSNNKKTKNDEVQIIFGNRLFISTGLILLPEFISKINDSFDGQLQQMDFKNPVEAAKEINKFVDEITKGKIPKITDSEEIEPRTLLYVVNALHFTGQWENVFDQRFKLPFYGLLNSTREIDVACQCIHYDEKWNFVEGPDWECIGIPYKNYEAWMFIVLPKERDGLPRLMSKMDYNLFLEFTKTSKTGFMRIVIPIFEKSINIVMNNLLQKLGVTNAFENTCDLSGMMANKGQISEVIHQATIKVDEYGTEASAATVIKVMQRNMPRLFTANHPFLYFIATTKTKNESVGELEEILFVGTFL